MIIKEDQGPKPDVRCFAALSGGLCGSTCARRSKRILLASNSKSGLDTIVSRQFFDNSRVEIKGRMGNVEDRGMENCWKVRDRLGWILESVF